MKCSEMNPYPGDDDSPCNKYCLTVQCWRASSDLELPLIHPRPASPPPFILRGVLYCAFSLSLTWDIFQAALDYTLARKIDRYQAQDVMTTVFENYVELSGDGRVSDDYCLKGGLARIRGVAVVVMGTVKGHTPGDMQAANYGEMCQIVDGF